MGFRTLLATWAGFLSEPPPEGFPGENLLDTEREGYEQQNDELWADLMDDEVLVVAYAEKVLAQWVVDRSPWTTYHAALTFFREDEHHYTIDYIPLHHESTMNTLRPTVDPRMGLREYIMGDLSYLKWKNEAAVTYQIDAPSFTNFTQIGLVTGAQLRSYKAWTEKWLVATPSFNPVGLLQDGKIALGSRMCFDFVNASLWYLHSQDIKLGQPFMYHGVRIKPKPLARDYLYTFAHRIIRPAPFAWGYERRRLFRYFRAWFEMGEEFLKDNFANAQPFLKLMSHLQLSPFMYYDDNYARLSTGEPFINYCFGVVAFPPKSSKVFQKKGDYLCAQPMDDLPELPWERLLGRTWQAAFVRLRLAIEERLDCLELPLLLLGIAVLSASRPRPKSKAE